ncbi:MAG: HAD-IA family hydrolase [Leptospirillia bacterium]
MAIQLILYDLDGTLVNSREDLAVAVNRTLRDLNLEERPHEELYGFVGNGVRMLLKRAVDDGHHPSGDPDERLDRALAIFREHYLNHLTDHSTLYPGVLDVLTRFSDRHQAIVTNKPMIYTDGVVRNLDLADRVGLVLSGDSTPHLKPNPAMLQAALDHFGVDAGAAVMVGDGLPDIEAARALDIPSAILTCGMGNLEEVAAAKPDFLLDRIDHLIPLVERLDGAASPTGGDPR